MRTVIMSDGKVIKTCGDCENYRPNKAWVDGRRGHCGLKESILYVRSTCIHNDCPLLVDSDAVAGEESSTPEPSPFITVIMSEGRVIKKCGDCENYKPNAGPGLSRGLCGLKQSILYVNKKSIHKACPLLAKAAIEKTFAPPEPPRLVTMSDGVNTVSFRSDERISNGKSISNCADCNMLSVSPVMVEDLSCTRDLAEKVYRCPHTDRMLLQTRVKGDGIPYIDIPSDCPLPKKVTVEEPPLVVPPADVPSHVIMSVPIQRVSDESLVSDCKKCQNVNVTHAGGLLCPTKTTYACIVTSRILASVYTGGDTPDIPIPSDCPLQEQGVKPPESRRTHSDPCIEHKTPFELLDLGFAAAMSECWEAGIKDDRVVNGWKRLKWNERIERKYAAKILRHLTAYLKSEDDVACLLHAAAIACNANILWHHAGKQLESEDNE